VVEIVLLEKILIMDGRFTAASEEVLDFNFWPSFSDLMLSLVLILILVIFLFLSVITVGTIDLRDVEENQKGMVQEIANAFGVKEKQIKSNFYEVPNTGIMIQNEPTLQRISFSDRVLFQPDKCGLSRTGKQTLAIVGEKIKKKLAIIREIQIQGHADTDPSREYSSNLELAALRAIEVFKYFQDAVGIDPSEHLMSATSFGEFKPVQRSDEDRFYNMERLIRDNSTMGLKDKNRRIELLLFYALGIGGQKKD